MNDVNCPYCGAEQNDVGNGCDPGPWWEDDYFPNGDCDTECDSCGKSFVVEVEWTPSFETRPADLD